MFKILDMEIDLFIRGIHALAKKKFMMSVTAASAIAAAFVGADEAEAASYKVKSGDSLWAIAQKHNTSVSQLKSINNLSGNIIFPNQVLETNKKQSSNTSNSNNNSSSSNASTYTVKSGDTLSGIAFKHNISISNLMKWNNRSTTLIYPGDKLTVKKSGSSSSSGSSNAGSSASGNSGSTGSSKVHTVKSGDTLSHIASRNGVTVANLKKWNSLSSDMIYVGQKISINGKSSSNSSSNNSNSGSSSNTSNNSNSGSSSSNAGYNVNKLVNTAKGLNGTPYVWGGSSTSGFDCSGFIHYTFKNAGKDMGRLSSQGYFDRSHYVNKPQVGDLVFFAGTYKSGISHLGIYLGNNEFIHAGSNGVEVSNLNNSYWKKHFDSYKRFY